MFLVYINIGVNLIDLHLVKSSVTPVVIQNHVRRDESIILL